MSQEDSKLAVYGDLFKSAESQMQLIEQAIEDKRGKGFDSVAACAKWAHDNLLDIVTFGKAQHQFYFTTHYGEVVTKKSWLDYYCNDVLVVRWVDADGKRKSKPWAPEGFTYYNKARIVGEISDGLRQPLHHRDYFTPTGYYDPSRGTFNIAKPFPVPAAETGADTRHLYTYIEHLAGECAPWLLAWLRTKMIWPTQKTQVVPIIVSRAQGSGKSTFADVICKGLFGADNVLVTDQYDSQSRFNADYADALVVCHEEKEETDRRNPAAAIKSRATATQVRKEYKGLDPIYQDSYTEFIMTTNKDVPIKFDDREDQRRFMVMGADENFTRKTSPLADEIFTKLYGQDADHNIKGIPFTEDRSLIAQFKHELYTNPDLAAVKLRNFPKTAAYNKCFTLPRTTENTEIEAILRALVPFITASLDAGHIVTELQINDEVLKLSSLMPSIYALLYVPATTKIPAFIALCRPMIFYDQHTNRPLAHATVERALYDCDAWLKMEHGLQLWPDMSPLPGGFPSVQGRFRQAPTARICRFQHPADVPTEKVAGVKLNSIFRPVPSTRMGKCLRVNGRWQPDPNGEFETVNELKDGVTTLKDKTKNVAYMDTFLFEADETTPANYAIELKRLKTGCNNAEALFLERLSLQIKEANRLLREGKALRVVYSGGKSYHILVRVTDPPDTLEEYKWLHANLCNVLSAKLTFDAATADPARLTRAPITFAREFMYNGVTIAGTQRLIAENPSNVFDYGWRILYKAWCDRPLDDIERQQGRRLIPTKPEYKDAMHALLHGTFWTDTLWNGRRQVCFFPAYRLCRLMGYTHEQLWAENGIMDGIDSYYRHNEIPYWRTRESCDLIKQIDKEMDDYDM